MQINSPLAPLDIKLANQIGGAIHRLNELAEKKIIEQGDAAEKRGQIAFLQEHLLAHANELLASWFTMEMEYRPLLQSLATVLSHTGDIIERRNQIIQRAQQPAPAPATTTPSETPNSATKPDENPPSNIIPLPVTQ